MCNILYNDHSMFSSSRSEYRKKNLKQPKKIVINHKLIFLILLMTLGFLLVKIFSNSPQIPLEQIDNHEKPTKTAQRDIYLGFWTEGFWVENTKTLNTEKLKEIERKIDKKVSIAHYYRGWEYLDDPEILEELSAISSNGWTPMLSANPYFFSECISQNDSLYKAIASGICDGFLHNVAKNLSQFHESFFFRFAWEMNIATNEWSTIATGSTAQEYVNAWRKFHSIMDEEGVSNVIWAFSPQVENPTSDDITSLYPGDQYVDWLGLDGYNWGKTQSWSSWQSFSEIFSESYSEITSISTKPLMIAEINTTDVGGNKADWYKKTFTEDLPERFPRIMAVVVYNENRSYLESVDWRIDASPDSLSAFLEAVKSPYYISQKYTK